MRNQKLFELQDISAYRKSLMGFAILLVLFYHFGFHTPPFNLLARFGYVGVDIFMFLSGFGLYYSLCKDKILGHYYRKRFIRIFPSYFFVGIFLSIFCYSNETFLGYIWKCSTLGFWSNGIYYEWFIPSLVMLYALFPAFYKLLTSNPVGYKLVVVFFLFVAGFFTFNYSIIDNWHFLLLYRIPIFLFGALIASEIGDRSYLSYFIYIGITGVLLSFILYLFPELRTRYFALTFLTPVIIMTACVVFKKVSSIERYLSIIGSATLEIYLIHLIFLKHTFLETWFWRKSYYDLTTLLLVVVSIAFGLILHKSIVKCFH